MNAAMDTPEQIATLRIELAGSDPVIWREVEVPTAMTLGDLHQVVQAAMGWDDAHLWDFSLGKQRFSQPFPDDGWGGGPRTIDVDRVRIRDLLKPRKTHLKYTYDLGDCWEHELTFTRTRSGEPGVAYPRYIGGERAAPPEDCGGIWGFDEALEALADPEHPDHEATAEWWGDFDPEALDHDQCRTRLSGMASRRARKRPGVKRPS